MESNCLQSTIANVQAKFAQQLKDVQQLLVDDGKLRTECKPYNKKYQAIEILKSLETDLTNVLTNIAEEEKEEVIVMLSEVHMKLGLLLVDTEELKAAEEQFMQCIKLFKNKEVEPKFIITVLGASNQLGIIWSIWNQPLKAKSFLDQAEKLYNDFMNTDNPCIDSINIIQNFGIDQVNNELSPKEVIEKVHTLTLYYLAQVHSSLNDHCQSAIYCHMTLRRQLGHNDIMQDLDYIDWALNAATLSQYFIENDGFSHARHHLATASFILQKYENMLKQKTEDNGEDEVLATEWENFKHRSADVARCWAKYGILLMGSSKQRLLQQNESNQDNNQLDNKDFSKLKIIDDLRFNVLEKEIESIANQVTDKYLLDFADARLVFLNAQKWLEQAKTYYTLENHASDHILIVQSISQAYKYLLFFEENEARQAMMHKKRINILENVIKELNPHYYKSACRQIWVELGETYSDILEIKLDSLQISDEKPTPQALTKINHLAKSAIQNFQAFLNSIQVHHSNSGPEQFSNELVQPALLSYAHLGKLYNNIITPDKTVLLENMQNSYNAYKFVIDYWKKYPNVADVIGVELSLCKELVNLLPMKINMLRERIINK